MKISTNKSKPKEKESKSKEIKLDTSTSKGVQKPQPSFSIDTISNGFIVSKSWTDENGKWHNERSFSETNPLEIEVTKK